MKIAKWVPGMIFYLQDQNDNGSHFHLLLSTGVEVPDGGQRGYYTTVPITSMHGKTLHFEVPVILNDSISYVYPYIINSYDSHVFNSNSFIGSIVEEYDFPVSKFNRMVYNIHTAISTPCDTDVYNEIMYLQESIRKSRKNGEVSLVPGELVPSKYQKKKYRMFYDFITYLYKFYFSIPDDLEEYRDKKSRTTNDRLYSKISYDRPYYSSTYSYRPESQSQQDSSYDEKEDQEKDSINAVSTPHPNMSPQVFQECGKDLRASYMYPTNSMTKPSLKNQENERLLKSVALTYHPKEIGKKLGIPQGFYYKFINDHFEKYEILDAFINKFKFTETQLVEIKEFNFTEKDIRDFKQNPSEESKEISMTNVTEKVLYGHDTSDSSHTNKNKGMKKGFMSEALRTDKYIAFCKGLGIKAVHFYELTDDQKRILLNALSNKNANSLANDLQWTRATVISKKKILSEMLAEE